MTVLYKRTDYPVLTALPNLGLPQRLIRIPYLNTEAEPRVGLPLPKHYRVQPMSCNPFGSDFYLPSLGR